MKSVLIMAVSWIVASIAFGSFMVNGRHTKIEEWLIGHIIANTFSNFFVPMYYIYTHQILTNMLKAFLSNHLYVGLIKYYHRYTFKILPILL